MTGSCAAARSLREGFRDGLPTAPSLALTFIMVGAAVRAADFTLVQGFLMSATIFAAPAQLLLIDMVRGAHSTASIALAVFLVNLRFALMSLTLTQVLPRRPFGRIVMSLAMLTATTFTVSYSKLKEPAAHGARRADRYFLGVCLGSYPAGLIGTLLGWRFASQLPGGLMAAVPMLVALYLVTRFTRDGASTRSVWAALLGFLGTPLLRTVSPHALVLVALVVGASLARTERPVVAA
jgi:predicted branched-subunit amino acid permease